MSNEPCFRWNSQSIDKTIYFFDKRVSYEKGVDASLTKDILDLKCHILFFPGSQLNTDIAKLDSLQNIIYFCCLSVC